MGLGLVVVGMMVVVGWGFAACNPMLMNRIPARSRFTVVVVVCPPLQRIEEQQDLTRYSPLWRTGSASGIFEVDKIHIFIHLELKMQKTYVL